MIDRASSSQLIPFSRSPQGNMFFVEGAYAEALARLQLMVTNSCLGVLTGAVGSGKSTLIRRLVQELDPVRYQVIYLSQAGMKPRDFYADLLRGLGEEPNFYLSKSKLLLEQVLNYRSLHKDKALVVIIDEAHDINPSMLLELRFALNHQMDSASLLSLILVGQPELRRILRLNKYEAIAQRIHLQYHLQGLTAQESATYIRHQMKQAGVTTPVFADSAVDLIHSETKGIPRLINTICTHALYEAKRTGSEVVEDAHIGRILADTERQRGTAM